MSTKPRQVLACVIEKDSRYLVCLRPAHKHHGGLWEFPGGKLEDGESFKDAAVREMQEELGLKAVLVGELVMAVDDKSSGFSICFVPVEVSGELKLKEHDAFKWATTEELLDLNLAPSDREFSNYLANLND